MRHTHATFVVFLKVLIAASITAQEPTPTASQPQLDSLAGMDTHSQDRVDTFLTAWLNANGLQDLQAHLDALQTSKLSAPELTTAALLWAEIGNHNKALSILKTLSAAHYTPLESQLLLRLTIKTGDTKDLPAILESIKHTVPQSALLETAFHLINRQRQAPSADEAMAALQDFSTRNPQFPELALMLAQHQLLQRGTVSFLPQELGPEQAQQHPLLAQQIQLLRFQMAWREQKYTQSISIWLKGFSLSKGFIRAESQWLSVLPPLLTQTRDDTIVNTLTKEAIKPAHSPAFPATLAIWLHTNGEPEPAIELLRQASQAHPNDPTLQNTLADIYFDLDRDEDLQTILASSHTNPSHKIRAALLAHQNNHQDQWDNLLKSLDDTTLSTALQAFQSKQIPPLAPPQPPEPGTPGENTQPSTPEFPPILQSWKANPADLGLAEKTFHHFESRGDKIAAALIARSTHHHLTSDAQVQTWWSHIATRQHTAPIAEMNWLAFLERPHESELSLLAACTLFNSGPQTNPMERLFQIWETQFPQSANLKQHLAETYANSGQRWLASILLHSETDLQSKTLTVRLDALAGRHHLCAHKTLALLTHPDLDPQSAVLLGKQLLSLGLKREALCFLSVTRHRFPTDPELGILEGICLDLNNHHPEAFQALLPWSPETNPVLTTPMDDIEALLHYAKTLSFKNFNHHPSLHPAPTLTNLHLGKNLRHSPQTTPTHFFRSTWTTAIINCLHNLPQAEWPQAITASHAHAPILSQVMSYFRHTSTDSGPPSLDLNWDAIAADLTQPSTAALWLGLLHSMEELSTLNPKDSERTTQAIQTLFQHSPTRALAALRNHLHRLHSSVITPSLFSQFLQHNEIEIGLSALDVISQAHANHRPVFPNSEDRKNLCHTFYLTHQARDLSQMDASVLKRLANHFLNFQYPEGTAWMLNQLPNDLDQALPEANPPVRNEIAWPAGSLSPTDSAAFWFGATHGRRLLPSTSLWPELPTEALLEKRQPEQKHLQTLLPRLRLIIRQTADKARVQPNNHPFLPQISHYEPVPAATDALSLWIQEPGPTTPQILQEKILAAGLIRDWDLVLTLINTAPDSPESEPAFRAPYLFAAIMNGTDIDQALTVTGANTPMEKAQHLGMLILWLTQSNAIPQAFNAADHLLTVLKTLPPETKLPAHQSQPQLINSLFELLTRSHRLPGNLQIPPRYPELQSRQNLPSSDASIAQALTAQRDALHQSLADWITQHPEHWIANWQHVLELYLMQDQPSETALHTFFRDEAKQGRTLPAYPFYHTHQNKLNQIADLAQHLKAIKLLHPIVKEQIISTPAQNWPTSSPSPLVVMYKDMIRQTGNAFRTREGFDLPTIWHAAQSPQTSADPDIEELIEQRIQLFTELISWSNGSLEMETIRFPFQTALALLQEDGLSKVHQQIESFTTTFGREPPFQDWLQLMTHSTNHNQMIRSAELLLFLMQKDSFATTTHNQHSTLLGFYTQMLSMKKKTPELSPELQAKWDSVWQPLQDQMIQLNLAPTEVYFDKLESSILNHSSEEDIKKITTQIADLNPQQVHHSLSEFVARLQATDSHQAPASPTQDQAQWNTSKRKRWLEISFEIGRDIHKTENFNSSPYWAQPWIQALMAGSPNQNPPPLQIGFAPNMLPTAAEYHPSLTPPRDTWRELLLLDMLSWLLEHDPKAAAQYAGTMFWLHMTHHPDTADQVALDFKRLIAANVPFETLIEGLYRWVEMETYAPDETRVHAVARALEQLIDLHPLNLEPPDHSNWLQSASELLLTRVEAGQLHEIHLQLLPIHSEPDRKRLAAWDSLLKKAIQHPGTLHMALRPTFAKLWQGDTQSIMTLVNNLIANGQAEWLNQYLPTLLRRHEFQNLNTTQTLALGRLAATIKKSLTAAGSKKNPWVSKVINLIKDHSNQLRISNQNSPGWTEESETILKQLIGEDVKTISNNPTLLYEFALEIIQEPANRKTLLEMATRKQDAESSSANEWSLALNLFFSKHLFNQQNPENQVWLINLAIDLSEKLPALTGDLDWIAYTVRASKHQSADERITTLTRILKALRTHEAISSSIIEQWLSALGNNPADLGQLLEYLLELTQKGNPQVHQNLDSSLSSWNKSPSPIHAETILNWAEKMIHAWPDDTPIPNLNWIARILATPGISESRESYTRYSFRQTHLAAIPLPKSAEQNQKLNLILREAAGLLAQSKEKWPALLELRLLLRQPSDRPEAPFQNLTLVKEEDIPNLLSYGFSRRPPANSSSFTEIHFPSATNQDFPGDDLWSFTLDLSELVLLAYQTDLLKAEQAPQLLIMASHATASVQTAAGKKRRTQTFGTSQFVQIEPNDLLVSHAQLARAKRLSSRLLDPDSNPISSTSSRLVQQFTDLLSTTDAVASLEATILTQLKQDPEITQKALLQWINETPIVRTAHSYSIIRDLITRLSPKWHSGLPPPDWLAAAHTQWMDLVPTIPSPSDTQAKTRPSLPMEEPDLAMLAAVEECLRHFPNCQHPAWFAAVARSIDPDDLSQRKTLQQSLLVHLKNLRPKPAASDSEPSPPPPSTRQIPFSKGTVQAHSTSSSSWIPPGNSIPLFLIEQALLSHDQTWYETEIIPLLDPILSTTTRSKVQLAASYAFSDTPLSADLTPLWQACMGDASSTTKETRLELAATTLRLAAIRKMTLPFSDWFRTICSDNAGSFTDLLIPCFELWNTYQLESADHSGYLPSFTAFINTILTIQGSIADVMPTPDTLPAKLPIQLQSTLGPVLIHPSVWPQIKQWMIHQSAHPERFLPICELCHQLQIIDPLSSAASSLLVEFKGNLLGTPPRPESSAPWQAIKNSGYLTSNHLPEPWLLEASNGTSIWQVWTGALSHTLYPDTLEKTHDAFHASPTLGSALLLASILRTSDQAISLSHLEENLKSCTRPLAQEPPERLQAFSNFLQASNFYFASKHANSPPSSPLQLLPPPNFPEINSIREFWLHGNTTAEKSLHPSKPDLLADALITDLSILEAHSLAQQLPNAPNENDSILIDGLTHLERLTSNRDVALRTLAKSFSSAFNIQPHFAAIQSANFKSYTQTIYRNRTDQMLALIRLALRNPDIFAGQSLALDLRANFKKTLWAIMEDTSLNHGELLDALLMLHRGEPSKLLDRLLLSCLNELCQDMPILVLEKLALHTTNHPLVTQSWPDLAWIVNRCLDNEKHYRRGLPAKAALNPTDLATLQQDLKTPGLSHFERLIITLELGSHLTPTDALESLHLCHPMLPIHDHDWVPDLRLWLQVIDTHQQLNPILSSAITSLRQRIRASTSYFHERHLPHTRRLSYSEGLAAPLLKLALRTNQKSEVITWVKTLNHMLRLHPSVLVESTRIDPQWTAEELLPTATDTTRFFTDFSMRPHGFFTPRDEMALQQLQKLQQTELTLNLQILITHLADTDTNPSSTPRPQRLAHLMNPLQWDNPDQQRVLSRIWTSTLSPKIDLWQQSLPKLRQHPIIKDWETDPSVCLQAVLQDSKSRFTHIRLLMDHTLARLLKDQNLEPFSKLVHLLAPPPKTNPMLTETDSNIKFSSSYHSIPIQAVCTIIPHLDAETRQALLDVIHSTHKLSGNEETAQFLQRLFELGLNLHPPDATPQNTWAPCRFDNSESYLQLLQQAPSIQPHHWLVTYQNIKSTTGIFKPLSPEIPSVFHLQPDSPVLDDLLSAMKSDTWQINGKNPLHLADWLHCLDRPQAWHPVLKKMAALQPGDCSVFPKSTFWWAAYLADQLEQPLLSKSLYQKAQYAKPPSPSDRLLGLNRRSIW